MKIQKIEIRTHPDPKRTRIFINNAEIENCRAVEFKIEDGQTHPTSIKLEFEKCIINMNSQTFDLDAIQPLPTEYDNLMNDLDSISESLLK